MPSLLSWRRTALATVPLAVAAALPFTVFGHSASLPHSRAYSTTRPDDGFDHYHLMLTGVARRTSAVERPAKLQATVTAALHTDRSATSEDRGSDGPTDRNGSSADFAAATDAMLAKGGRPTLVVLPDGRAAVGDSAGKIAPIVIPGAAAQAPAAPQAGAGNAPSAPIPAASAFGNPVAVPAAEMGALRHAPGVHSATALRDGTVEVSLVRSTNPAMLPGVDSASKVTLARYATTSLPNDPDNAQQWAFLNTANSGADIGATGGWPHSTGAGVIVADIDSGLDATNPDLTDVLWTNPKEPCGSTTDLDGDGLVGDCHGWNYGTNSGNIRGAFSGTSDLAQTANSHGSAVGGVIAAAAGNGAGSMGLAPSVKVMELVPGAGGGVDPMLAAQAVYYAVDHGAKIINNSWDGALGGGGPGTAHDAWVAAMAYAAAHDVLVVDAAGNAGGSIDASSSYATNFFPGSTDHRILVSATDNKDQLPSWSNYGPTSVDIAAPGAAIVAPWPSAPGGFAIEDGTSLSSPMVAAAAAMLWSVQPHLTALQVKQRILDTATPLISLQGKVASGSRLNVAALLSGVPTPFTATFSGISTLKPDITGTVTARLGGDGSGLPDGPLGLRLTVAAQVNGKLYAVNGLSVDAGAAGKGQTGTDGVVNLAPPGLSAATLSSGLSEPLTMGLPAGNFGLVAQLTSSGQPVGRAQAVTFQLGAGGGIVTSIPGGTGSSTGSGGPVTATAPAPSASATGGAGGSTGGSTVGAGPSGSGGSTSNTPPAPSTSPSAAAADSGSTGSSTPVPSASSSSSTGGSGNGSGSTGSSGPGSSSGSTATPAPVSSSSGAAPAPVVIPASTHFGITRLSPGSGSTEGGTVVELDGTTIPASPSVLFDGAAASVIFHDSHTLTVATPPDVHTGPVDVTVFAADGTNDVLAGAYTYIAPGSASNGGSGSASGSGSSSAPSGGTGSSPAAGSTPAAPASSSSAASPAGTGAGSPSGASAVPVIGGGLTLAPPASSDGTVGGLGASAWGLASCSDACPGTPL